MTPADGFSKSCLHQLERSFTIDQRLLAHLSPLKWEHINLTGDYHWRRDGGLRNRKLRPLRSQPHPRGFASQRTIFYKQRVTPGTTMIENDDVEVPALSTRAAHQARRGAI